MGSAAVLVISTNIRAYGVKTSDAMAATYRARVIKNKLVAANTFA